MILSTIECQTKSKLVKSSSTLFSLLLETFKLRDATKASSEDFEDDEVEQLEAALIETILSMTLKLNDATFRPFFSQLVDMAASSSVTFYRFLAAFFDKFKVCSAFGVSCNHKLTAAVHCDKLCELHH